MPDVISAAGDCFNRIAKTNGFFNYLSIYGHDNNAANFPNPNQIAEGSTVKVPDKQMKPFKVPVDTEKKFRITRYKTSLKIKLCKARGNEVPAIAKAKVVIGTKHAEGTTGTLNVDDIDPALIKAALTVTLAKPAAFAGPPANTAPVVDQNPPAITAADFDDPKTVWPTKGEIITWDLNVGSLEPHTVVRGVLQRLQNFGFTCPVQQAEDAATKRAVKTYRRFVEGLADPADTDAVADIQAHILTRHDAP